jgi:tRNA (guanosine-2'-O-)-methyltransferase
MRRHILTMTRRSSLLGGVLLALCAGCLEVPKPPPKDALDVKDVRTSEGMSLESACMPSGVEMCFDALDNNCNGVIDEGCGLHTGILQFTIAWPEAAAEVDLTVTGPDGDEAQGGKPTSAGLLKDRDCPGTDNQCYGQNVENVFLAEGRPRSGRYRAVVLLRDAGEATPPIKVRFSARIGQRHFTSLVLLKDRDEQREFEFTL